MAKRFYATPLTLVLLITLAANSCVLPVSCSRVALYLLSVGFETRGGPNFRYDWPVPVTNETDQHVVVTLVGWTGRGKYMMRCAAMGPQSLRNHVPLQPGSKITFYYSGGHLSNEAAGYIVVRDTRENLYSVRLAPPSYREEVTLTDLGTLKRPEPDVLAAYHEPIPEAPPRKLGHTEIIPFVSFMALLAALLLHWRRTRERLRSAGTG